MTTPRLPHDDRSSRDILGVLQVDVAVAKNDIGQVKTDVHEIKQGQKAIMEGYVPVSIYVNDQKVLEEKIRGVSTRVDVLEDFTSKSKPGIDFSNGIVKEILKWSIIGIAGGAILIGSKNLPWL